MIDDQRGLDRAKGQFYLSMMQWSLLIHWNIWDNGPHKTKVPHHLAFSIQHCSPTIKVSNNTLEIMDHFLISQKMKTSNLAQAIWPAQCLHILPLSAKKLYSFVLDIFPMTERLWSSTLSMLLIIYILLSSLPSISNDPEKTIQVCWPSLCS